MSRCPVCGENHPVYAFWQPVYNWMIGAAVGMHGAINAGMSPKSVTDAALIGMRQQAVHLALKIGAAVPR